MIHDLRRLFKAASAYYKMMEFGDIKDRKIQEELAAALVDVRINYDTIDGSGHTKLEVFERLKSAAMRTRERSMAKLIFDDKWPHF